MNAVHNTVTDIPSVLPTGRAQSKPINVSFRDIRESILKSQQVSAPAKADTKDSEIAAEQGMGGAVPIVQSQSAPGNTTTDQDALQAVDTLQQQISKCCDFTGLTNEIADILEGFGLLKSDGTTIELTQEGKQILQQMINNVMSAEQPAVKPDVLTVAGNEAGMLKTAIPDDAQQTLQLLIKEYVCSLENANNVQSDGSALSAAIVAMPQEDPAAAATAVLAAAVPAAPEHPSKAPEPVPVATAETADTGTLVEETAAQKDPFMRLVRALTQVNQSAAQETAVQTQEPALPQEAEPAQAGLGASFPVRQPNGLQNNVSPDMLSPAVTQADMSENISNIVEEMAFRSEENVQEFSVSLKPEHLGELVIKLTKGPEGLLAQIKAADASTKGLIQNEVAALTEQLKGKGIEIRQIEVVYEAPAFTTDMRQNDGRREAATSPSYKSRNLRATGIEEPYGSMIDSSAISTMQSLDSSVEYQA